jgi:hypothetical protein
MAAIGCRLSAIAYRLQCRTAAHAINAMRAGRETTRYSAPMPVLLTRVEATVCSCRMSANTESRCAGVMALVTVPWSPDPEVESPHRDALFGGPLRIGRRGRDHEVHDAARQIEADRREKTRPSAVEHLRRQLPGAEDQQPNGFGELAVPSPELGQRIASELAHRRMRRHVTLSALRTKRTRERGTAVQARRIIRRRNATLHARRPVLHPIGSHAHCHRTLRDNYSVTRLPNTNPLPNTQHPTPNTQ